MGFSSAVKAEIAQIPLKTLSEKAAFLSAIVKFCSVIHKNSAGVNIEIVSDNANLIFNAAQLIKEFYNKEINLNVKTPSTLNQHSYTIKLPMEITDIVAQNCGLFKTENGVIVEYYGGIVYEFDSVAAMRAYIAGMVASISSFTVPQKKEDEIYEGGYHFEMQFASEDLAYDVMELLAQIDIMCKKIERVEVFSVYLKESGMICDLIEILGAKKSLKELKNIINAKLLRNNTNRAFNCSMANIDKVVEAGTNQLKAILLIEKKLGLESLPVKLKEVAQIRKENLELNLDEIAELIGGGISKSGVNHRFRKIMEIARSLEDKSDA